MPITIATIDSLRRKRDELPPQDNVKREVSQQEAVALLAEQVSALQGRGYAIDEIASLLSSNGLPVSVPTLKSYLSRARAISRKGGAKPRRTARGKLPSGEIAGAECKSMNGERKPESAPKEASTRIEPTTGVGSGGFIPRDDSIDI